MRNGRDILVDGGGATAAIARTRRFIGVDLFCGAGSLSAGARDALQELGLGDQDVDWVAVNHWDIATKTFADNHPGARVHCVSLENARPCELVPEGHVDLLMAGIECTYFSRARGGKPVHDQQRMSGWHVVRWCTDLRVDRLLLENVPEFVDWGPVDPTTGRPIRHRKGEYFRAFVAALRGIGYRLEHRVVNCADHGDPTTRKRLLILGWLSDKPIPWPAPSHARKLAAPAIVHPWRSAREHVIDWSIPGQSIFTRPRPLAPKTLQRIWSGIVRHKWPEPFLVILRRHCETRSIDLPLPTVTAGGTHIGLVEPFILNRHGDNGGCRASGVSDPAPTVTGSGGGYVVAPFILSNHAGGAPRSIDEPVPGIVNKAAPALIAPYYGDGSGLTCGNVDDPLPTLTTKARFGLVVPITHNRDVMRARSVDDPLPTITTAKRGELALVASTDGAGVTHDILYRMLQPHELARAMSISTPERPYRFVGNKTQVVRQIGQAVPRRTGYAHVKALMGADL
jgi:DNA (cytosine-5)-methyltransferase 1